VTQALGEFERIARFFAPLAAPEALGLKDDAAYLDPPPGERLVFKTDAIVESVHFLPDDPPDLVARKALRVNLSDLAAKAARPLGYLLAIALPKSCDDAWLEGFAGGLAADQREFGIGLFGGDTDATPGPITIAITAIGAVSPGREILRAGAQPGDRLYVSGTLGDAALGLRALTGKLGALPEEDRITLADRYRVPRPRLGLGRRLGGIAHAGLDISDGLVADLGHLCEASGVGAVVEQGRVPLSPAARRAVEGDAALRMLALGGGDDYELVFAAPPESGDAIAEIARQENVAVTAIGQIEPGARVRVLDGTGEEIDVAVPGYRHF
jgi:thiamine-monophosphate kinase